MKKSGNSSSGNTNQVETTANEGHPKVCKKAQMGLRRRFPPPGPTARPLLALDLDDILRRIEERLADLEVEESEEDEDF